MTKKIVAAAFLFSLFASVVFSADWVFFGSSNDGKTYHYDRASVKNKGGKVTFATRLVYAQPEKYYYGNVNVEEDEWWMDCRNRLCQITYEREYDENGKLVHSLNTRTSQKPEMVAPGSFTETLYQHVCR